MAHCAIYEKGSDKITYFIQDCVQSGRDYRGSNGSVTGVKEDVFDVLWTETIATPILDETGRITGYDLTVPELAAALRYEGRVVSSRADVNAVTRALIAVRYPASEETKILRLKLAGDETGWAEYQSYVDGLVQQGRAFKDAHFPEQQK